MKVAKYRTNELLDSIFTVVYPQEIWASDMRNTRKLYKACDALLNTPEKPWQEYEKQMKKFRKYLNRFVAEQNLHNGGSK